MTASGALMQRRRTLSIAPIASVSDSFARANSAISAGSTDSYAGGSSQAWTPAGGATFGITSNQLYAPVGSSDGYLTVPVPSQYMEVRAIFAVLSSNNLGLVAGFVDINNFYLLQVDPSGGMHLYERIAGNFTSLGSGIYGQSISPGDEVGVRIEPVATTSDGVALITLVHNGVDFDWHFVSTLVPGTNAGIREDSIDVTWRIKNFRVLPIPARKAWSRAGAVVSPSGAEVNILNPDVKFLNGQWVMAYSPETANGTGTSLAYSSDLRTWTKDANNPMLDPTPAENSWATDGSMVAFAGAYYFYYFAALSAGSVSLATSATLSAAGPWTRHGWIGLDGIDLMVRLMAGPTIEMWYIATSDGQIHRATSTDGFAWTDHGAAIDIPASFGTPGAPYVFTDTAGLLHLYFCAGGNNTMRSIHEAISADGGSTWTLRPYRLTKTLGSGFDHVQVFDPSPVQVGNAIYHFYCGSPVAGNGVGMPGAAAGLVIAPLW